MPTVMAYFVQLIIRIENGGWAKIRTFNPATQVHSLRGEERDNLSLGFPAEKDTRQLFLLRWPQLLTRVLELQLSKPQH